MAFRYVFGRNNVALEFNRFPGTYGLQINLCVYIERQQNGDIPGLYKNEPDTGSFWHGRAAVGTRTEP